MSAYEAQLEAKLTQANRIIDTLQLEYNLLHERYQALKESQSTPPLEVFCDYDWWA